MVRSAKKKHNQPSAEDEVEEVSSQFDRKTSLGQDKNGNGEDESRKADGSDEEIRPFPDITPPDIVIAVMGMTGVGKSTFIKYFADEGYAPEIGHSLESCTWRVELFPCTLPDGTKVYLVDTPGFDDTHKGDADILREIANWLDQAYAKEIKLTGIVYLHRIFDNRLTGSAMKNLRMFRKLCGDQGLGSVILATTQWSKVTLEEGDAKERELRSKPSMWKTLVEKGAKIWRQDRDEASAMQILEYLVKQGRRTFLNIQEEMANGAKLEDTAAGSEVLEELKRQQAQFDQEIKELRDEMEEAIAQKDREKQNEIKEMTEEYTRKQQEAIENERKLAADSEKLRRQKEHEDQAERQRMQEDLLRKTAEVARSEAELEFLKERHQLNLDKQWSDLDALHARAEVELLKKEQERLEDELRKSKAKSGCVIL